MARKVKVEVPSRVVLAFADGYEGVYTYARSVVAEWGYRAMALVPTAEVGGPGRLTVDELLALQGAGWDVASHLDRGDDCTELPTDELRSRLESSHRWLRRHGFVRGSRTFGPPKDQWEPELTPLAVQAGYRVVLTRAERGGLVPSPYSMRAISCANRYELERVAQTLDKVKERPNILLRLGFHDVVPANPHGSQTDVQRLRAVLSLVQHSGLVVVTVSDLLDGG